MGKPIKILYTIPNFDTAGSGKVVYDLIQGLDKSRFSPEICCFHTKGDYFKVIESLNVPIHVFNFATNYKPFGTLPFRILSIALFFKKHRFQLIHSWHWSSDFTEPLAAKLAGIPFVYTKKAMGWGNKSWTWRSRLSSKIVAINRDMMTSFFLKYKEKTIYIPLGVDINLYTSLQKSRKTPEGIRFEETDFVIVSVANLVPVKGIEVLLEAVKIMDDISVKVLIVGDNENAYGKSLKQNYQSENIFFLGKQMDIIPYLAVADTFVIPTKDEGRKEGLPIAPLEAMTCQRLVVGSKIPGIKDILEPFEDCLFKPGDSKDLSRKLLNLKLYSENERETLARKMHDFVITNFSLMTCVKTHETLYQDLKNNKK